LKEKDYKYEEDELVFIVERVGKNRRMRKDRNNGKNFPPDKAI